MKNSIPTSPLPKALSGSLCTVGINGQHINFDMDGKGLIRPRVMEHVLPAHAVHHTLTDVGPMIAKRLKPGHQHTTNGGHTGG